MMKTLTTLVICTSIVFFTSSGCMNSVEKTLIGRYKIGDIKFPESSAKPVDMSLVLNNDKTFLFKNQGNSQKGKWEAGDNGDITWLNLYSDGKEIQFRVLGEKNESIELLNSYSFFDKSITHLSFLRE